ncbi:MAG TPA: YigZ family protein [Clostridia bacterium]|nr:YigZ family protein [Clostridia bacterium]
MDEYTTVNQSISIRRVIERSRFLAHVKEVESEEQARQFINAIKEEHRQATHNCSAYVLGISPHVTTYSDDDGEPSGTAGKPILGAILKQELTNVAVVVTRYFGGKKLGIRGLIDAYGGVAEEALVAAGRKQKILETLISLTCSYDQVNRVMYLVDKYQARVVESSYTDKAAMVLSIRRSLAEELRGALAPYVELDREIEKQK